MLRHELPITIFHVCDAQSWPSIQANGLLTTATILRRWDIDADLAHQYLTTVRREPIGPLQHPEFGVAWIRDQSKMGEAGLTKALNGSMTISQWCQLLNSMTFFFPRRDAAEALLASYAPRSQVVLALRTASLLDEYESLVKLASINTGYTQRRPALRGPATFSSVSAFRGTPNAVKEVAIRADIIDVNDHLTGIWEIT